MGVVGGISALFGFFRTLGKAKKSESKIIEKGGIKAAVLLDEGSALAMRALGWGTLYAVLGTGTFCFGVWKLSGAKNVRCYKRSNRLFNFANILRWKSFEKKWERIYQK